MTKSSNRRKSADSTTGHASGQSRHGEQAESAGQLEKDREELAQLLGELLAWHWLKGRDGDRQTAPKGQA